MTSTPPVYRLVSVHYALAGTILAADEVTIDRGAVAVGHVLKGTPADRVGADTLASLLVLRRVYAPGPVIILEALRVHPRAPDALRESLVSVAALLAGYMGFDRLRTVANLTESHRGSTMAPGTETSIDVPKILAWPDEDDERPRTFTVPT